MHLTHRLLPKSSVSADRPRLTWSHVVLLLGLAIQLGCAGTTIDESNPTDLARVAEEDIEDHHYQMALDRLKIIRNKFPYAKEAVQAQLRMADVYFLQESYTEAASQYEIFRDLHPRHPQIVYVEFRIGKSYFEDSPTQVERDLSYGQKALKAYREFVRKWPGAPETKEAHQDCLTLKTRLAEKEWIIGNFYRRRLLYHAARPRYQRIIQLYADTQYANLAQMALREMPESPFG